MHIGEEMIDRDGPSLLFLNGTRTVGGVQVLLTGERGRLVFDLGVIGNPGIVRRTTLFNSFLPARRDSSLADYLRAGMAPLVDGLFDARLLDGSIAATTERLRAPGHALDDVPLVGEAVGESAVFVSHLHDDHMALLPFVSPDVPVLMSDTSAWLHRALVAAGAMPPVTAPIEALPDGARRCVGDLDVETVAMDHDVPGSAGIVVSTRAGTVAYTGDWRLHGAHPELVHAFVERCAGRVDVLVTEASTARRDDDPQVLPPVPEPEIASRLDAVAATAGKGLYCSFHERNLERQAELQQVAAAHGRVLVLSPRTYAIWENATSMDACPVDPSKVAVWSVLDERPSDALSVTTADVAADPRAFLCELRHEDLPRLLDAGAGPDDTYVYLNGYPHGPADPGWDVLMTWIRQHRLRLEVISSHGHALPDDLRWLVDTIKPRVAIPVHSNSPESFPRCDVPVRPVRRGETVVIGDS